MQIKKYETFHVTRSDPGEWGQTLFVNALLSKTYIYMAEKVVDSECVCIKGNAFISKYLVFAHCCQETC